MKSRFNPRSIVLLLFFIFILPFIAAYWFYQQGGTGHTSNYGELLNPPKSITTFLGKQEISNVKGKWVLLLTHPQACPLSCKDRIQKLKNLKKNFLLKSRNLTKSMNFRKSLKLFGKLRRLHLLCAILPGK